VAFQIDDLTRAAWCVMFSEMEGNKFNWDLMQFEDDGE
jgi:hypothetical protein